MAEGALKGKVALVTGAARGIGRSIALEFARRGADLVLNDLHSIEEAEHVAGEVKELGSRALVVRADVSKDFEVNAMVRHAVTDFGGIDLLVNNAAYSVRKPMLDMTMEEASRSLDVTLWGTYVCSHHVARAMVSRNVGGCIVMIGSVHGEKPYPNASPYNMAKAGVSHLAASLALELAPNAIRVNTVEPGWIDTLGERFHNTEKEIEERGRALPFERLGSPEEVAKAVAFLCSDEASYITGANLRVDGGFALKF